MDFVKGGRVPSPKFIADFSTLIGVPVFDQVFVVETDASSFELCAPLAYKKADRKVHRFQFTSRTINSD